MGFLKSLSTEVNKSADDSGDVFISTGSVNRNYDVVDCIFALDSHSGGLFTMTDPSKAFDGVKKKLVTKCIELHGDAVIDCEFEYRIALDQGLLGSKQCVEIFAYGTVVRFKD